MPPSAANDAPVMNEALSDATNTTAWAISSALPMRFSGTPPTRPAFLSSLPVNRVSMPYRSGQGRPH
jgi:hypothetical protein